MNNYFKIDKPNGGRNHHMDSKGNLNEVQKSKMHFAKLQKSTADEPLAMAEDYNKGNGMDIEKSHKQPKRVNIRSIVNDIGRQGINLLQSPDSEDMTIELRNFEDREEQYHSVYGESYRACLIRSEPKLKRLLQNTKVTGELRAKMVDWMLEVIQFYRGRCSIYTYFKAVLFMDLYLINYTVDESQTRVLENRDLHLVGITAIFLASKYEDHSHMDCQRLLDDSAKGKFKISQVEKLEWKILKDIGFNTTVPTHFEILDCILKNNFSDRESQLYHKIRWFSILLIMRSLHFHALIQRRPYILSLGCLVMSIQSNYNSEKAVNLTTQRSMKLFQKVEIDSTFLIDQILMKENLTVDEKASLTNITENIRVMFTEFEKFYPNLKNVESIFTISYYMEELQNQNI